MHVYGLTYLPKADHRRADEIRRLLSTPQLIPEGKTPADLNDEMVEIESRRKPLDQTNIQEAMEMKSFLYEKMTALTRIGKGNMGNQFYQMIRQVEARIHALNVINAAEEEQRRRDEKNGKSKAIRPSPVLPRTVRTDWAAHSDDDDSDVGRQYSGPEATEASGDDGDRERRRAGLSIWKLRR